MIPRMARLSRRSVVGAAVVGTVGGCSGGGSPRSADGRGKAPAPGTLQRAQAARDSLALLARYDATLAAYPALAGRLSPLRAHVALHASAFGGRPPAPAATPASPTALASAGTPSAAPPTPRKGAGTASPAPAVPSTPAAALAALAAAERTLADRRAAALLTVPGELARLMASVAAAGAAHVVLLTPGAKTV